MRTLAIWMSLLGSAAIAQTPPPRPTPPFAVAPIAGEVKGDETDQMRANDAPCLAKFNALSPRPHGMAALRFMVKCKANGP